MEFKSSKGNKYETEEQPFKLGGSTLIWKCLPPYENLCIKEFRQANRISKSQEFKTELERLSTIEHPNILKVIDFGDSTHAKSPFIVYELCDGNLREILLKHDYLPEDEALIILKQVSSALDYLHKSGTIHGDIKPENILFKGKNLFLLSDFGYSKHIGFDETLTVAYSSGMAGTTLYLSPEQLSSNIQTQLSDIYSLSFVAYELFTGQKPIDRKVSIYQQIKQKIEDKIIDPLDYNPQIKSNIKKSILKNLSSNPKKRSISALYFMNELEGNIENEKTVKVEEKQKENSNIKNKEELKKHRNDKKKNQWGRLNKNDKVIIIVAVIGALATIIAALLG